MAQTRRLQADWERPTMIVGELAVLSEEKRLIPNFCPLLRSQEWQEGNS